MKERSVEGVVNLFQTGRYVEVAEALNSLYDLHSEPRLTEMIEQSELPLTGISVEGWMSVAWGLDLPTSLFNLAVALWEIPGQQDQALNVLRDASKMGSADSDPALVEYLVWLERFDDAQLVLDQMTAAGRTLTPRLAGLAGEIRAVGNGLSDARTRELLTTALDQDDDFTFALARVMIAHDEWDDARQMLIRAADSGDTRAPIVLGNVLQKHFGDLPGAEEAFRAGIAADDSHSAFNLSLLLEDIGRQDEADFWLAWAAKRGDEVARNKLAESDEPGGK